MAVGRLCYYSQLPVAREAQVLADALRPETKDA